MDRFTRSATNIIAAVTALAWLAAVLTGQSQQAEIEATGIPPTSNAESALIYVAPPGAYTAIVRGKNNTTGVALVEIYNLQ